MHAIVGPFGCIDPHPIDHEAKIRIIGQRQPRPRPAAVEQPPPYRIHCRPARHHRRTGRLRRLVPACVGVLKQPAVAVVAVTLGRCAIGQQHIMRFQLNVVDQYCLRPVVPQNGPMIDQEFDRNQQTIDEKRMPLGHMQIGVRHVGGQRPLAHDHRCGGSPPPARRQHTPLADPGDRAIRATRGPHPIADRQTLHRALAGRGGDQRAGQEAQHVIDQRMRVQCRLCIRGGVEVHRYRGPALDQRCSIEDERRRRRGVDDDRVAHGEVGDRAMKPADPRRAEVRVRHRRERPGAAVGGVDALQRVGADGQRVVAAEGKRLRGDGVGVQCQMVVRTQRERAAAIDDRGIEGQRVVVGDGVFAGIEQVGGERIGALRAEADRVRRAVRQIRRGVGEAVDRA